MTGEFSITIWFFFVFTLTLGSCENGSTIEPLSTSDSVFQSYQSDNADWLQVMYSDQGNQEWHIVARPNLYGTTVTRDVIKLTSSLSSCFEDVKSKNRLPTCFRCLKGSYWITFLSDQTICLNKRSCRGDYLMANCLACAAADYTCEVDYRLIIDDFTCQSVETQGKQYIGHDVNDICKVANISIKPCRNTKRTVERITWYTYAGLVYFVENPKVVHRQDPSEISSYNCTGGCTQKQCASGKCSGSPEFCSNFGCSRVSKCKCAPGTYSGHFEIKSRGGQTIVPKCIGSSEVIVHRNVKSQQKRRAQSNCPSCSATCSKKGIHLTTQLAAVYSYKVCRSSYCIVGNASGSPYEVELPHSMLVSSTPTKISLWVESASQSVEIDVLCESQDLCQIIDCAFCMEIWRNPSCYTMWTRISLGLLILLALVLITTSLWLLKHLLKSIRAVCSLIFCCCGRCRRPRKVRFAPLSSDSDDVELAHRPRKKKISRRFALMGLASLASPAWSCTETTNFQASASTCIYGHLGMETCRITHEVRLAVSPVGQDSCYILRDPDNKPMGSFVIRTESVNLVCDPALQYYVPEAEPNCMSSRSCWRAGKCSGTTCENWKTSDNIDGQPQSAYGTGWSYCERVCGCAGCGCFYCLDSCLFYRKWLVNSKRRSYSVSKCEQWFYEVAVTVIKTTTTGTETSRLTLRPGVKERIYGMEIDLISVSTPPQPVLNRCIITSSIGSALVPCNERGEYSLGKIGEIQCQSAESARNMDHCLSDPKIITVMKQSDTVSCRSAMVSPLNAMKQAPLPIHLKGMMIATNGTKLIASLHAIAMMELQLSSDELQMTAQTDKSNCFADVKSFSGCYSCLTGAVLSLEINTDFGSALGVLECNGINLHAPLQVIRTSKIRNVTIHVSVPEVSTTCRLICPAGTTKFRVTGSLKYIPVPETRTESQVVGIQVNPKDTSVHLPSLAWNLFSTSTFLKVMLALILAVVIFLILYCSCKWCPRRSRNHSKRI